ncbi:hypothetical protein [Nesterenkonia marinintestina]|uniref:hypothetical protein n=1 Tax=Nesterenkonia marinintestina TaxID=2979865 RepID=UPI0021C1910C|nr:hypothetical protein [Nesterenkonia sp. GX14115]
MTNNQLTPNETLDAIRQYTGRAIRFVTDLAAYADDNGMEASEVITRAIAAYQAGGEQR